MLRDLFSKLTWLSWLIWPLIFLLWPQPFTHHYNVPFWILAVGLIVLLGTFDQVAWPVWIWWCTGSLTLIWSLTPGNTLNIGFWEILYVAAFAAGAVSNRFRNLGFWIFNAMLFTSSLYQALAVSAFGGNLTYFSGSIHYILGAQALVLVLPLFALLLRNPGKWMLFIWLGSIATVYAVAMSGARAVYLPFVVLILLAAWRSWRGGVKLSRVLLVTASLGVCTAVIDLAIPFHPIQTILGGRIDPQKQLSDSQGGGSFASRLQMWDQTLGMAIQYPLGTGNGSFKDVLPAFIKHPTVTFSSAHNYYIETVATGGWLRLIALLGLLYWSFRRGLSSDAWSIALGVAGLWATLAFDITGYFPQVMMLAFAGLGVLMAQPDMNVPKPSPWPMLELGLRIGTLTTMIGMTVWWFVPCTGDQCAIDRHLGRSGDVLSVLRSDLKPEARNRLLNDAERLNPKSVWVWQARLQYAGTPPERLRILREIATRFPLLAADLYLEWAKTAITVGNKTEAIQALQVGLQRFPPGLTPAGAPLTKQNGYSDWLSEAQKMLSKLQ
jgi:O-antigen ligase